MGGLFLDNGDVKFKFQSTFFEQDPLVKQNLLIGEIIKNQVMIKVICVRAGDRKKKLDEYNETFLRQILSPQEHEFNSGVWNRLEEKVRYWAVKTMDYILLQVVF